MAATSSGDCAVAASRTALVTGCFGFIGSHLVETLLDDGWSVRGVDCLLDSYELKGRKQMAESLKDRRRFEGLEADLLEVDLDDLLDEVNVVFHLAARAGVRTSWGGFDTYLGPNLEATHHILHSLVDRPETKLVFASSSSIYGQAQGFPTSEDAYPQPISPYGVTKLAGEHLVSTYVSQFGVDARSLRYFTVYGPRQRSDMAFHIWIRAAFQGEEIRIFGDGSALRDFTFVNDVVRATVASTKLSAGTVCNVAGGNVASIGEVVDLIAQLTDRELKVVHTPTVPGDPRRTTGDTSRLRELTGWAPVWALEDGLRAEIEWMEDYLR